jgi:hypothetical protein
MAFEMALLTAELVLPPDQEQLIISAMPPVFDTAQLMPLAAALLSIKPLLPALTGTILLEYATPAPPRLLLAIAATIPAHAVP